ncbi:integrase [Synechococcus phage S-LBS1]|nr:integrase [Synechococcus phage S-LBS1]
MTLTLAELWDAFVAERSIALCPTSLTSDYRQIRKWLQRCPVQDTEQARQIMIWVLGQTPVLTSRRVAMYVKSMYKWASQEDVAHLVRNPIASFKMPKAPQRDIDIIVIPRNEVGIVLAALAAKCSYQDVNWSWYTEFMLQTAMRTGEVRALQWSDIKENKILVHSNWTLTHGYKDSTKTNKKRWVPLNSRCQAILEQLPRENECIFPWNRLAFQSYFRKKLKPLHSVGLISHLYRPYDCRHTAISRWIEAGIPVPQVANWAGNTSEVIFKHYCNTTQEYEMPVL